MKTFSPTFHISIILPAILCFQLSMAQETVVSQFTSIITEDELRQHVYTLAADSMEGRFTGAPGQKKAAKYIASEFDKAGVGLISGTERFQEFNLEKCNWYLGQISRKQNILNYPHDFILLDEPLEGRKNYNAVFGGFGLVNNAYSDLNTIDIEGKVVVAFSGEPKNNNKVYAISGGKETSRDSRYYNKFRTAAKMGAKGMILIAPKNKDFKKYHKQVMENRARREISYPGNFDTTEFFGAYTTIAEAALLFDISEKELLRAYAEQIDITNSGLMGKEAAITVNFKRDCSSIETENVVGFVEGSEKKDEYIVVAAHYDHLGKKDKKIYNGADDNASGTAAIIEIAEAFKEAKKEGFGPSRSVIFLLVSAEELGLYGSRYFTENCPVDMENIYAVLNIDMIGRVTDRYKDNPNYIWGWGYNSEELVEIARNQTAVTAPSLNFHITYSERKGGGSDHYYFVKQGIPAIFYFTGIHKDYHEPGDVPKKVLYSRMEKITRSIFATAYYLANRDEPLVVEE